MIVNLISNQQKKITTRGPKKVLDNLLKGLDLLEIEYVINQPLVDYEYNWIQDSKVALIEATFLKKAVLLGPNLVELPDDIPKFRKQIPEKSIYLHPSKWTKQLWKAKGFEECPIEVWPVGIDTYLFKEIKRNREKVKCLVYFKNRKKSELKYCIEVLNQSNIDYEIIQYGNYNESDFFKALNNCNFGIWIGSSESQGIALQETLATNLPLVVIECDNSLKTTNNKQIKLTSVPYFDMRCGRVLGDIIELDERCLRKFIVKLDQFSPREYILENLSLEKSTKQFISLIKKIKQNRTNRIGLRRISHLINLIELSLNKSSWFKLYAIFKKN